MERKLYYRLTLRQILQSFLVWYKTTNPFISLEYRGERSTLSIVIWTNTWWQLHGKSHDLNWRHIKKKKGSGINYLIKGILQKLRSVKRGVKCLLPCFCYSKGITVSTQCLVSYIMWNPYSWKISGRSCRGESTHRVTVLRDTTVLRLHHRCTYLFEFKSEITRDILKIKRTLIKSHRHCNTISVGRTIYIILRVSTEAVPN